MEVQASASDHADMAAASEGAVTATPAPAAAAPTAEGRGDVGQGAPATGAAEAAPPEAELLQRVAAVIDGSGFWKRTYGSKSPMVRQAAYSFTAQLAAG